MREADAADWVRLGASPFAGSPCLVACVDGEVAAFLVYRRVASDESEILYLETLDRYRRGGLARELVREFKKRNPGQLFLEVRESNAAARQLYLTEGFSEISVRKGYYETPYEGAIVMKFHSC